jgi:hypothetical protein
MITMDPYYNCYKIIYKTIYKVVLFNLNLQCYLHKSTQFYILVVLNSVNLHKIGMYNYVRNNL